DLQHADEAKPMYERALWINQMTYGPMHRNVIRSVTRLSSVLRDLGDTEKAQQLFERVRASERVGMSEEAAGSLVLTETTHASQITLQNTGDKSKAKLEPAIVLKHKLAIAEQVYGPNHPIVATILSNMADLSREPHAARRLLDRALAIIEATYA